MLPQAPLAPHYIGDPAIRAAATATTAIAVPTAISITVVRNRFFPKVRRPSFYVGSDLGFTSVVTVRSGAPIRARQVFGDSPSETQSQEDDR